MNKPRKCCLVTGASSGIGRQIAHEMVGRGWLVVAVARRKDRLDELADELGKDKLIPFVCDVAELGQVKEVSREMQGKGLVPELFFLNAGDGDEEKEGSLELDYHRRIFDVNYFGVMNWVSLWLPIVLEKGGARFVASSSMQSFKGMPGSAAYGASKAALNNCFESLDAFHHTRNVRFVLVYPGPVDTPMLKTDQPLPVTWKADKAARYIVKKVEKGALKIKFPMFWRFLITLLRMLPNSLYLKVMSPKEG